jgi:hypothetical protein
MMLDKFKKLFLVLKKVNQRVLGSNPNGTTFTERVSSN